MMLELGLPKTFVRFAAVALIAAATSACSSVPNWVDPTNWMGGSDQTANADTDQSNASTPDLASIPDKPVAPSTVDERTQVADTLKADRVDAQYSADALRGGTEPSAAPPSNAPQVEASISPSASAAPAESSSEQQQPASAAAPDSTPPAATAVSAQDATTPDLSAPAAPAAPAQVASTEPAPAVASTPVMSPSDDQLGFQTSKAPPLDPSVAHFVAPAVLDQYQHTSAQTSAAPALTPPAQTKPDPAQSSSLNPPTDSHLRQASYTAPSSSVRSSFTGMATPASYTPPQQAQPSAVVFFPRDAAVLGAKAKAQILAAAQSFQGQAGTGFLRVVGHSSSRTGDMPMARHLAVVFEHSQDFATAVANELIRDGVPADKVLIEAVGDSQPVYYESMPQGEAGNRRAEIFL
jgi:outer membrane protein OmpA-like peptidoglycan-associated protein